MILVTVWILTTVYSLGGHIGPGQLHPWTVELILPANWLLNAENVLGASPLQANKLVI